MHGYKLENGCGSALLAWNSSVNLVRPLHGTDISLYVPSITKGVIISILQPVYSSETTTNYKSLVPFIARTLSYQTL